MITFHDVTVSDEQSVSYQPNCQRDLPRFNGHSKDPFTRRAVSLVSANQLLCPLSYLVNQMIQMWLYNDSYRLTCGPGMAGGGFV